MKNKRLKNYLKERFQINNPQDQSGFNKTIKLAEQGIQAKGYSLVMTATDSGQVPFVLLKQGNRVVVFQAVDDENANAGSVGGAITWLGEQIEDFVHVDGKNIL